MNDKFTHIGTIKGRDNRTSPNYAVKVLLRATKTHWVTENGIKYNKETGCEIGDSPMFTLDIGSVYMRLKQ